MPYLYWDEKTITDFSDKNVSEMYDRGYLFTRIGKGVMQQTRSGRINLSPFELTSENKRILKKIDGVELKTAVLPLKEYDIKLGKLAKDFYDTKFGHGIMSAQKVKEMLTDKGKSNFNRLLKYIGKDKEIGWTISYLSDSLLHYSYPFYDLGGSHNDMGLGMMIQAIQYAKDSKLKYIYLGSLQRSTDTYKLQFKGLEWFDGKEWQTDIEEVKRTLAS